MNINELEKKLKELEAEINKCKLKKEEEWPKVGDYYWFRGHSKDGCRDAWHNANVDRYRKQRLQIFKTKKECERYYKVLDKLYEIQERLGSVNWNDKESSKYHFSWSTCGNKIYFGTTIYFFCGTLYFNAESKEQLKQILFNEIGQDELEWFCKYQMGVL